MGRFVKGDVVVVPFPFSDLSSTKRRPALVAAALGTGDDGVLCQITSRTVADNFSIHIAESDFVTGDFAERAMCVQIDCSRRIPELFFTELGNCRSEKCGRSLPRLLKSSVHDRVL